MRPRSILAFFLSAAVMLALVAVPFDWSRWTPEACRLRNCYCEPFRWGYFVLQPITALSNLGYLMAGWIVLLTVPVISANPKNPLQANPAFATWLGISLNITAWFSFLSHASLTRAGEWLDLMGVYQLAGFLLLYNLRRLVRLPLRALLIFYALILAVLGLQMIVLPQVQQICIALLIGAAGIVEILVRLFRHPQGKNWIYGLALLLFAAGAVLWGSYGRAPVCLLGQFPWHVGWHLLSAAAVGVLYCYYISEDSHKFRISKTGENPPRNIQ